MCLRRRALLALILTGAAALHCSSPDEAPIGGPFQHYASSGTVGASGSGSSGSSSGGSSGGSSSGSSSGSSAACGNDAPGVDASAAPTFTQIYTQYFGPGTPGGCSAAGCHPQMDSPSDSYKFLQSQTLLCGPPNCLASLGNPCNSILAWFGGAMPLTGTLSDPQAAAAVQAWAAAGAQNN